MGCLIGLTGRARSGKNTAAQGIAEAANRLGLSCKEYQISQYVINALKKKGELANVTREALGPEGLSQIVMFGSAIRKENPFYWIEELMEDVYADRPDVAILPNIRFPEEAFVVRDEGRPGKIIRVTALIRDGLEYISPDRDPNHPMETTTTEIKADYFLTAIRGQTKLLQMQAGTIFEYIQKHGNQ